MAKIRMKVPGNVKAGDIITIKSLISHRMESGQRKDPDTGKLIPRQIIDKFTAKFDGEIFFESDWQGSVAANPFIAFTFKAEKSGEIELTWHDENGEVYSKKGPLTVG